MHPHVHVAQPGVCPICGMDLLLKAQAPTQASQALPLIHPDCVEAGCVREQVSQLLAAASSPEQSEILRSIALMAASDEGLVGALDDEQGLVRSAAAVEIARRGLAGALSSLRAASIDGRLDAQGWSRLSAIDALARLGGADAGTLLRPWLDHEDAMARLFAVGLSGRHPELRVELERIRREDPHPEVRAQAQLSLATLGDTQAIAELMRRDDAQAFRTRLQLDPSFAEELAAHTARGPELPLDAPEFVPLISAISALLEAGDPRGRQAVHRVLQGADELTALPLLQSLQPYATRDDIPVIVPHLASQDPLVRTAAAVIWWQVKGQTRR